MATRRIVNSEKTVLDKDDMNQEKSDIAPAVPKHVIFKLIGFTLAMIVFPLGSYMIAARTFFKGNNSYAGGLAAFMANLVLVGYIIVAMQEDQGDGADLKKKEESKKDR